MVPKVHRVLTPSANQGLLQTPKIHPLLFPLPPDLGRGSIDFVASNQDSEVSVTKAMAANQDVQSMSHKVSLLLPVSHQGSAMAALQDLVMETKPKVERPPQQVLQNDLNGTYSPPYFLRLRNRMPWWQKHGSLQVQSLVTHGVPCPHLPAVLSMKPCIRSQEQTLEALQIL